MKQPYVKKYNAATGEVQNPITPGQPYNHQQGNSRQYRRGNTIYEYSAILGGGTEKRRVNSYKRMVDGKCAIKQGSRYTEEPKTRYKR